MTDSLSNKNEQNNAGALVGGFTNSQTASFQGSTAQMSSTAATGGANASQASTIVGVFNSQNNAEKAVTSLRAQGFTSEEINIISKKSPQTENAGGYYEDDDISDGTLTGGTIGGLGGLLLGAGALAIPGIGPILAAGPIAAALGGAVAGGIAGGLIDWGIPAEAGERYEQHVAQGSILAIVRTTPNKVQQAAQILRQHDAQDVESHKGK